jgi:hypothetical protein
MYGIQKLFIKRLHDSGAQFIIGLLEYVCLRFDSQQGRLSKAEIFHLLVTIISLAHV